MRNCHGFRIKIGWFVSHQVECLYQIIFRVSGSHFAILNPFPGFQTYKPAYDSAQKGGYSTGSKDYGAKNDYKDKSYGGSEGYEYGGGKQYEERKGYGSGEYKKEEEGGNQYYGEHRGGGGGYGEEY